MSTNADADFRAWIADRVGHDLFDSCARSLQHLVRAAFDAGRQTVPRGAAPVPALPALTSASAETVLSEAAETALYLRTLAATGLPTPDAVYLTGQFVTGLVLRRGLDTPPREPWQD